jgi:hypothetical protein
VSHVPECWTIRTTFASRRNDDNDAKTSIGWLKKEKRPAPKIIFVSQESSPDVVQEALDLGAWGYVSRVGAGIRLISRRGRDSRRQAVPQRSILGASFDSQ